MGQHKLGYFLTQGRDYTTLRIIHDGSTLIHLPETTISVSYSMTLIFRQRDLYTALAYLL